MALIVAIVSLDGSFSFLDHAAACRIQVLGYEKKKNK